MNGLLIFSNQWKTSTGFFQGLEDSFPLFGKRRVSGFTDFQGSEKRYGAS